MPKSPNGILIENTEIHEHSWGNFIQFARSELSEPQCPQVWNHTVSIHLGHNDSQPERRNLKAKICSDQRTFDFFSFN